MRRFGNLLLWIAIGICSGSSCERPDDMSGEDDPNAIVDPVVDPDEDKTGKTSLSYSELLEEMISYDGLTRYPEVEYESRQESSRDRKSTSPDDPEWFANDDGWGYERIEFNDAVEKVIFDEQHPGVITRMWLTSFGSPQTVLRFYFDGAEKPSWKVDTYNLKHFADFAGMTLGDGLAQPSSEWIRGSSLYLPITYAKSCKITIEELVEPTTISRYYHINYRRYPDDFAIETLTPQLLTSNKGKIKTLSAKLLAPQIQGGETVGHQSELNPGQSSTMELKNGSMAVSSLTVSVSVDESANLSNAIQGIIVKARFDGNETVAVPLVELMGTGRGGYYMKSWRFECNGLGTMTSRWTMPYKSDAEIVFLNCSEFKINLSASAVEYNYSWDERSLYFHAAYKQSLNFPIRHWSDYGNGIEWNFATIEGGRGVYSGDIYTINNYTMEWPGEGDEKIWVDEEDFPSHFGTGVEDYYSFCGYFRFNTPFSGEPRLDAANFRGYNTHYRTRNLDVIPFKKKLVFNLEMEGHAAGEADLENAVFWYGDALTKANGTVEY